MGWLEFSLTPLLLFSERIIKTIENVKKERDSKDISLSVQFTWFDCDYNEECVGAESKLMLC